MVKRREAGSVGGFVRKNRERNWLMFAAVPLVCLLLTTPVISEPRQTGSAPLAEAESLLAQNNFEQATNLLSAYLKKQPSDIPARLLLAQAYFLSGKVPAAEEEYQKILKRNPNHYLGLAGLGELYERTGQFEKSESLLAKAVKLSHGEPELREEWATVLVRLHRYQEAFDAVKGLQAPAGGSERVAFFRLKAAIASGRGDSASAAAEMERALDVRPNDLGLQAATAAALLQASKWEDAAKLSRSVFSATDDASAGLLLLQAEIGGGGDSSKTLVSLRGIQMPPEQELAFRQRLAEVLLSGGHYADAITDLKRAAELAPERPDILFNIALAEYRAGHLDEALTAGEKSMALHDGAELQDLMGDIQEARGDNLAAVRSYQAAVAMAPNEEKYHLSLALEFIRHSNFEPAKLVLTEAAEKFPDSWRIQLGLGMIAYFTSTKQEASKILLHAADLAPQPEAVFRYLGDIELDEVSVPDGEAINRICRFADQNPKAAREQMYCGALRLRKDYASRDRSNVQDIELRLNEAAKALPKEPLPHCELGKLHQWLEEWDVAQRESETCAKMDPGSAQAHYRLAQIYRHNGQKEGWQEEMQRYEKASQQMADENATREQTRKTFVYSVQNEAAEPR